MRLGWLARCLLIAVAVAVLPADGTGAAPSPPAASPAASIGLRLIDGAATANGDPRARVYIVDHASLGGVIRRQIEVTNTTGASAHIALYSAAATIEHGTFVGAAGRTQNDVSTWTSVVPAAPDVPAGGRAVATVIIRVARDAAPAEHYGVVWAEVRSGSPGGVVQVSRVGIRIYLSVGPGGAPAADFTIGSVRATRSPDGGEVVTAGVHNTGGRALDMVGTLQLSDGPGGVRAGPFPVATGTTVAVGESAPVTIALTERLPAGPWSARVVLRSGLLERRAQATITFADKAAARPADSESTGAGWVSAAIVGLAATSGCVALVLVVRRRWRRRSADPTPDAAPDALHVH